jgi:monoamine oxidase
MQRLIDAMSSALSLKQPRLRMGSKVARIARETNDQISLTNEKKQKFTYDHVISTLPLGILRDLDTSSLGLSLKKRMAMRMLAYSSSVKIAIKFKTRWWQSPIKMGGKPIMGGQTFTDLPIRKVIYPSYGINCTNAPGILTVSYTWAQDATRIGSRVTPKIPSQRSQMSESKLIADALDQLALIHGAFVKQEYANDYFVMNWNDNPLSMGAFSLFGPAEYQALYRNLIKAEANGFMHMAGEYASVHHGWLEGAVNSAYRSVMEILMKENMQSELTTMQNVWGTVDELEFFS